MRWYWMIFALPATVLLGVAVSPGESETERQPPAVVLEHDREAARVSVSIRGEHFTTYHYGEDARTPFLWPVNGEGGVGLTRNFPMEQDEPRSTDHRHHRSLFLTYGDVNGYDHWHRERIDTESIETGTNEGYAFLRAHNHWLDRRGEVLMEEVQEIRFHDRPASGRFIDVITTFKATRGDVRFGDDKEGLLAFRIRPDIQGNRAGVLTNDRGDQGERRVYGVRSRWMDYAGPIEGHGVRGIAVFDHPSNFRHPTTWHVRDYGLAAANPFGLRSVAGEDEDGSHTLEEGETMRFIYRIYVHSGDHEQARVGEHYDAFAKMSFDD